MNRRSSGTRTLEEEITGIFWGYDGPPELGTPPRLYMQIVLTVLDAIEARHPGKLDTGEELAVIAGVAIAMADAGIEAWHYKYDPDHMMRRPVVGIQNAVNGNGTPIPAGYLWAGQTPTATSNRLRRTSPPTRPGMQHSGRQPSSCSACIWFTKAWPHSMPRASMTCTSTLPATVANGRNIDPRTMLPREHLTRPHKSLWQAITDNSLSPGLSWCALAIR